MNVLEALRLLVGLPAVLLLPGWAWSLAFWPAWGPRARPARALEAAGPDVARQGLLERAVVSLALSIALVPLAALAWSAGLGLPLGTVGSLAVVALVTALGLGAWQLRVRRAA